MHVSLIIDMIKAKKRSIEVISAIDEDTNLDELISFVNDRAIQYSDPLFVHFYYKKPEYIEKLPLNILYNAYIEYISNPESYRQFSRHFKRLELAIQETFAPFKKPIIISKYFSNFKYFFPKILLYDYGGFMNIDIINTEILKQILQGDFVILLEDTRDYITLGKDYSDAFHYNVVENIRLSFTHDQYSCKNVSISFVSERIKQDYINQFGPINFNHTPTVILYSPGLITIDTLLQKVKSIGGVKYE